VKLTKIVLKKQRTYNVQHICNPFPAGKRMSDLEDFREFGGHVK